VLPKSSVAQQHERRWKRKRWHTVNREMNTLRAMLNEARSNNWITVNPFTRAKPGELISTVDEQPRDLHSVSATFTRVLLTTLHIARKLKMYMEQQPMLFRSNWSLIQTTGPRSPIYALVYWAGGLHLKRTALQRSFMARFELC
jgi:hypothetical protein